MTVDTRPLAEINRAGRAALVRELGVVDAMRFINQYSTGSGDYTAERHQWLDDLPPLEDLFREMQQIDRERAASAPSVSTPSDASDV